MGAAEAAVMGACVMLIMRHVESAVLQTGDRQSLGFKEACLFNKGKIFAGSMGGAQAAICHLRNHRTVSAASQHVDTTLRLVGFVI